MNRRVKYYKPVHCANSIRGEIIIKEFTGTLLQICNDGSFIIENDETKSVDTIGGNSVFSCLNLTNKITFID